MTPEEIRETFRYHSPAPEAIRLHERIRERMTEVVVDIARVLPDSRERSTFITLMQQAQMMANAAVAIHGLAPPDGDGAGRQRRGPSSPDPSSSDRRGAAPAWSAEQAGVVHRATPENPALGLDFEIPRGVYDRLELSLIVDPGAPVPYWQMFYLTRLPHAGSRRATDMFGFLLSRNGRLILRHGFGLRFVDKPKEDLGRVYLTPAPCEIRFTYDARGGAIVLNGGPPSFGVNATPNVDRLRFNGRQTLHLGLGSTPAHGGIQPGWLWRDMSIRLFKGEK